MHLPIHIGFGDMVEIDQGQCADTAACQRFCGPGAHATNAYDDRMGATDAGGRCLTVGAGHPTKTALGIRLLRRRLGGTDRSPGLCSLRRGQGSSTVEPVVLRPSRSRWAWAASASA